MVGGKGGKEGGKLVFTNVRRERTKAAGQEETGTITKYERDGGKRQRKDR